MKPYFIYRSYHIWYEFMFFTNQISWPTHSTHLVGRAPRIAFTLPVQYLSDDRRRRRRRRICFTNFDALQLPNSRAHTTYGHVFLISTRWPTKLYISFEKKSFKTFFCRRRRLCYVWLMLYKNFESKKSKVFSQITSFGYLRALSITVIIPVLCCPVLRTRFWWKNKFFPTSHLSVSPIYIQSRERVKHLFPTFQLI